MLPAAIDLRSSFFRCRLLPTTKRRPCLLQFIHLSTGFPARSPARYLGCLVFCFPEYVRRASIPELRGINWVILVTGQPVRRG